jgi:hypothetical protein
LKTCGRIFSHDWPNKLKTEERAAFQTRGLRMVVGIRVVDPRTTRHVSSRSPRKCYRGCRIIVLPSCGGCCQSLVVARSHKTYTSCLSRNHRRVTARHHLHPAPSLPRSPPWPQVRRACWWRCCESRLPR